MFLIASQVSYITCQFIHQKFCAKANTPVAFLNIYLVIVDFIICLQN